MTTFLTRLAATDAGRPPRPARRPASGRAVTGLAVTPFGGGLYSFAEAADRGALASAAGQTSLLYIWGSAS